MLGADAGETAGCGADCSLGAGVLAHAVSAAAANAPAATLRRLSMFLRRVERGSGCVVEEPGRANDDAAGCTCPDATNRLVRAVDALQADDLAAPSLLPAWSRAHVVAHLALNAEGLERVLTGLRQGERRTMYDSPEARDSDIEDLAGDEELRERFLASTSCFARAVDAMTDDDRRERFELHAPAGRPSRSRTSR